jgi:hypothetical protein
MVPVHSGGLATTYEVHLARAEAGEGPTTEGLRGFVEALELPMTEAETIRFRGANGTQHLVLLDRGQMAAIAAIESP